MKSMERTKKLALLANFLAIAIVLNIIESAIPVIPVPGAKLGFANVVTIIVLYVYSFKDGMILSVSRVVLVSVLTGRILGPTFYMSLSGAVVSTMVMGLLMKTNYFGIVGVSVLGSIFHTFGQIAAGVFVIGSIGVLAYLPVMLFLAIPAGLLTGFIAKRFFDIWKTWQKAVL